MFFPLSVYFFCQNLSKMITCFSDTILIKILRLYYNNFLEILQSMLTNRIHCLGDPKNNLKKSSSILKGKIAFMKQLHKWLGEKCKWNLCYRASRDGWRGQDFHRYCDNKGSTVTLVKANNCIFGGYTDQNWQGM